VQILQSTPTGRRRIQPTRSQRFGVVTPVRPYAVKQGGQSTRVLCDQLQLVATGASPCPGQIVEQGPNLLLAGSAAEPRGLQQLEERQPIVVAFPHDITRRQWPGGR
jgi:hypothetical protein